VNTTDAIRLAEGDRVEWRPASGEAARKGRVTKKYPAGFSVEFDDGQITVYAYHGAADLHLKGT
jgi:uncharacterized protein Veg